MTTLAQRIKAAREAYGLSQNELAKRAGVAQGYLSQIESGERHRVSGEVLQKLAHALTTTVDALLGSEVIDISAPPLETLKATGAGQEALDRLARRWPRWGQMKRVAYLKLLHETVQATQEVERLRALVAQAEAEIEEDPEVVPEVAPQSGEAQRRVS